MRDFKILTDSCCDIPDYLLKQNDIDFIPFYMSFDGKNYLKERVDISIDDFYNKLLNNKDLFAKTSFPPLNEFISFFRAYLKQNMDILYISMTSKFSGVFAALMNIIDDLKAEFPGSNIIFLDSNQVSMGEGLLILEACKAKKAGCSIFQTADFINKTKFESKLFCTVNSLNYLQKGGRIGKVALIASSLFNIKPIIAMQNGELTPYSKVRGRKKAIEDLASLIAHKNPKVNLISDQDSYEYAVFHSSSHDEALEIKNLLLDKFNIKINLPIIKVGVVIGSHIGPTVLAVARVKKFF